MRAELAAPHPRLISHLDRLSAALWIILAVTLPFELKTPLVSIGPLAITNVELVLYGVIALWIVRTISFRQFHWTPVHWTVLAWMSANVISAVFAPTLRGEAMKFALRSLAGALLFFAAADWARRDNGARSAERVRAIGLALGAGAVISAVAGVVEVIIPASVPIWLAFKTHVTVVGEVLRASGTFQYANTAAMYWEAALPIGLAAVISRGRSLTRHESIGLVAAVLIVTLAIVLSVSRAALLGTSIALVLLIILERGTVRHWAVAALALLIGLTIAQLIASPVIASRFRAESDRAWYLAQIDAAPGTLTLRANAINSVPVTVTNTSVRPWLADGSTPVRASYHWLNSAADMIIFEGARTALPHDVEPGESAVIDLRVVAPPQPGDYHLQIDLVQEHVTWFGIRSGQVISLPVHSSGASAAAVPPTPTVTATLARPLPSQTRIDLWRIAFELWRTRPLFGIGPDNFRWMYGTTLGATNFNQTVTANSWYVETLVNTGLIGLSCLIALGLTLLRAAIRARRDRSREERMLLAGLIAALAAFAVHGVVDYFLPFTPTYALFWLAAGLLTGRAWSRA